MCGRAQAQKNALPRSLPRSTERQKAKEVTVHNHREETNCAANYIIGQRGSKMNGVSMNEYEAAATLASLISAPISSDDTDILFDAPLRSRSNSNLSTQHDMSHEKDSSTGTRKFTRDDDIHLIRGILEYGRSSWKKIWKETPELQHIKHAALKDRGRSKRFQNALKWAEMDPTLLDRPFELLGDENSHWYSKGAANPATAMDVSPGYPQALGGDTKPLFWYSPQEQMMEEETESTFRPNSKLPTIVAGSATKKKAANGKNKRSGNDENKPKKAPKKATKNNTKGLRTLRNGEKDKFPGWTLENVQRKQSKVMERFWSHPSLHGIQVRSRVGMREMVQTMEEEEVDASAAYEILVSEGKRKYFVGSYRKQP